MFPSTRDELMLSLTKDKQERELALALRFRNRSPNHRPLYPRTGCPARSTTSAVSEPGRGLQDGALPHRQIVYRDLWPGIDLRLREQSGVLKYEFHVRPGASPSDIHLAYAGRTA